MKAIERRSTNPLRARYALCLLTATYTLYFLDRNVINILLEPIKHDLAVSDTALGFLTGFAFLLFYTILGIPVGHWADRADRRSIIALGLGVWSLMTLASGLAQNVIQLAIARAGVGIGESAGNAPAQSLLSDYFPPGKRGRALAIYSSGLYIGGFLGYFLGGSINQYYGWRIACLVAGTPGIVLALLLHFTVTDPSRGNSEGARLDDRIHSVMETLRFVRVRKSFILLTAGFSLTSYTNFAFSAWTPSFFVRIHHLSSLQVGTYVGAVKGLMGLAGTILGGCIADRMSRSNYRWVLLAPAVTSTASGFMYGVFLFSEDMQTTLFAFGCATLLAGFQLGPVWAATQGLVKVRMRALASSILLMISSITGAAFGPLVIGMLNDAFGSRYGSAAIRYSLLTAAMSNGLGGLFFLLASRFLVEDSRQATH